MNFGIGSPFSKAPGTAFSEGPGPGRGLLYKVCLSFKNNSQYITPTTEISEELDNKSLLSSEISP